jgi:hypothetical protein
MIKNVPFPITAGLPFSKTFIVTLPTGRNWWTNIEDFEAKAQVREKPDVSSSLVLDFAPYMTLSFDNEDVITITIEMTGQDTRNLTRSGFYDVILSDFDVVDERAHKLSQGPVRFTPLVTSE